ncbi:hypothetical protein [Acetivibrio cellulolyticus]|nr:hypothetical protein [Acetivibrio cellulolyticus]
MANQDKEELKNDTKEMKDLLHEIMENNRELLRLINECREDFKKNK